MEACTYLMLAKMLSDHGIRIAVISSGSRNAAISDLLGKMPGIELHTVLDERTAGFYALGRAKYAKKPVVLLCTSGSAILNYGPALSEAARMRVPLIVVSADRPAEQIDANVGQTIRQSGLFPEFFKYSVDLDGVINGEDAVYDATAKLSKALNITRDIDCGPVHINLHLNESAPIFDRFPEALTESPKISCVKSRGIDVQELKDSFNDLDHKRVIIYDAYPGVLTDSDITRLGKRGFVVISESLISPGCGYSPDLFLAVKPDEWQPEYVIYLGCAPMNREYIRRFKDLDHLKTWYVSPSDDYPNTFGHLEKVFITDPRQFVVNLLECDAIVSAALELPKVDTFNEIMKLPWCDLKATAMIVNTLSFFNYQSINSSNGMTLRNLSLISGLINPWKVYANRGVNGIEGSTSTAIGLYDAECTGVDEAVPGILFTGDMSAKYDIGALFAFRRANFHMVVFNNGGGEIFRRIKNTRDLDTRESLIAGMVPTDWQAIAAAAGYRRFRAASEKELSEILADFLTDSPKPSLLEIVTEPGNSSNYDELLKIIKQKYHNI